MGHGRWDASAWAKYASAHKGKSRTEIFTSGGMKDAFDPAKIGVREFAGQRGEPAVDGHHPGQRRYRIDGCNCGSHDTQRPRYHHA